MYQQQVPQLPMPANQVAVPWMNLSVQYPPFVPAGIQTDPAVASLIPAISALAAFQVQRYAQEAQNNPLRVFMYNICAVNQWQNGEFEGLIVVAVDLLWLGVLTQRYQTPELGLQAAVETAIGLVRSANLERYPDLARWCDPQLLQAARVVLAQWQQTRQEIVNTKQRMAQQAQGQQYGYGAPPVYGAPGGYGGAPMPYGAGAPGPYGGPGYSGSPQGNAMWKTQLNTNATAMPTGGQLFGSVQGPASGGQGGKFGGGGRYDQSVLRQPEMAATPTAAEPVMEVTVKREMPAEPEKKLWPLDQITWKPSEQYPYLPAYNPQTQLLMVEIASDGVMIPRVRKKENVVDFDRHAVASSFGSRPKNLDLTRYADTLERLQDGVRQINEQTPPEVVEGQDPPPALTFSQLIRPDSLGGADNVLREISQKAAWLVAGMDRLRARVDDKIPDLYRVHAQIFETVVGTQNETGLVRGYGACETFIELREKLNASINRVSPTLWTIVNRRMTRAVNRMVKQNLSVPGLEIDSFVDDIEELIKIIEGRYGEIVTGALMKFQAAVIRRTLTTFSDDLTSELSKDYLDSEYPEGVEPPKLTFVASNISFTLLNCWSYELNLQLQPGVGCTVRESFTPLMHQLVKGIFEATTTLTFETEHGEFDTHLIQTLDGRVLEAQRGFLDDEHFVLTLVD